MSDADYTPTTEEARECYVYGRWADGRPERHLEEFDRWLSTLTTRIREEALAEERAAGARAIEAACENAWREGYYTGKRDYAGSLMGGASISTENPYYAARIRSEIPEGQNDA